MFVEGDFGEGPVEAVIDSEEGVFGNGGSAELPGAPSPNSMCHLFSSLVCGFGGIGTVQAVSCGTRHVDGGMKQMFLKNRKIGNGLSLRSILMRNSTRALLLRLSVGGILVPTSQAAA